MSWRRSIDISNQGIHSRCLITRFFFDCSQVINNIFDEYTLQIRAAYGVDQGLGSILGKSKVQVSKIAGALHATALASAVFDQLINQNHCLSYYDTTKITFDLLKKTVKNFKETHKWTLISEATAQAAVILMNYFITQKKIYTNSKSINTKQ